MSYVHICFGLLALDIIVSPWGVSALGLEVGTITQHANCPGLRT